MLFSVINNVYCLSMNIASPLCTPPRNTNHNQPSQQMSQFTLPSYDQKDLPTHHEVVGIV